MRDRLAQYAKPRIKNNNKNVVMSDELRDSIVLVINFLKMCGQQNSLSRCECPKSSKNIGKRDTMLDVIKWNYSLDQNVGQSHRRKKKPSKKWKIIQNIWHINIRTSYTVDRAICYKSEKFPVSTSIERCHF